MSNAVNHFPVIGGFLAANYYTSAAGQLAGDALGFSAFAVFAFAPIGTVQHVVGNKGVNKGWQIGVTAAGLIFAKVGDGAATVTLTAPAAAPNNQAKFVCVELRVAAGAGGACALFIDGELVDADVHVAAYAPSAGVFSVGYNVNGVVEAATGVLLAAFGLNGAPIATPIASDQGNAIWLLSANTPGGALSFGYGGTVPATLTAYRVIFDNDGLHPAAVAPAENVAAALWAPYLGTAPVLTRTGIVSPPNLTVTNISLPWA